MPLQAPVEGGFTVDDFTVDEKAGTVTCPNDITRPISRTRVATFGAACRDCPLRAKCTTYKTGRKIVLHQRDTLLRAARRDWAADPDLRKRYRRTRPNVERVISPIRARVRPPPPNSHPSPRSDPPRNTHIQRPPGTKGE